MRKFNLNDLNSQQRTAVEAVRGRVLILAGAGSGKTLVLTMRMAHLILNLEKPPQSILGLTFTNKAAAEMRHRLASLVNPQVSKYVTLSTFHSFCMDVLRHNIHHLGYTLGFSLYHENDVERLIKNIARQLLEHEKDLPSLTDTIHAVNQARNKGLKPEEIKNTGSEWHDEFTRQVYTQLQLSMRAYNALDFDNLLWLTVELFEKHPEVLKQYQERFQYVMIDEYQDTNPIQDRLAALLTSHNDNLCVVGDDDQSIYGWRGAEVANILRFDRATVIKLEQNYRSTNTILKAANAVIGHNQTRHAKVLWSDRGDGESIEVFVAPDEVKEAEAVVYRLLKLRESYQLKWSDIAILYRSNALSRQFEQVLLKKGWRDGDKWVTGIPYQIVGGLEFYERQEIKDLFAYLRVLVNPLDQEALLRIINQPRRGIGEASLDILTQYNRQEKMPLWELLQRLEKDPALQEICESLPQKALQGIREFISILEGAKKAFATLPLSEAMTTLIEKIHYQKAIIEEVKSDKMREFKWDNVQEFVSAMAEYEQQLRGEGKEPSLAEYIATLPLQGDALHAMKKKGQQGDCVTLMTFHSAKGLEYKACFLVGMEDHIIPHEKSLKETGIEEERRLMYVALTRAMRFLTISMAKKRMRMGKEHTNRPSRFLMEIPPTLIHTTTWEQ
jgi:DNA helicase-2/ATP-dependent DNA helicase PcrA